MDSHYPAPYHSILYHTWTVNSPQNTILQRTPKLTPINININKMQIKQKYRKKKDGEIQKCNSLTGSSGSCCHLPNLIFSAGCTINTSTPAQTHSPYHNFSSLPLIFTRPFSPFFLPRPCQYVLLAHHMNEKTSALVIAVLPVSLALPPRVENLTGNDINSTHGLDNPSIHLNIWKC